MIELHNHHDARADFSHTGYCGRRIVTAGFEPCIGLHSSCCLGKCAVYCKAPENINTYCVEGPEKF